MTVHASGSGFISCVNYQYVYTCICTTVNAAYVRQLMSISEKLSAVTINVDSCERSSLSTDLIVIDVNSLSADCSNIKVTLFFV